MTPHQTAARIAEINTETFSFVRDQMQLAFDLVNDGNPQANLDAFPDLGLSPAEAIEAYGTLHNALAALSEAGKLTAPNLEVFQVQENGTVIYVEPFEEEP